MAKYKIEKVEDITSLVTDHITNNKQLEVGDIIVHKPFSFAEIQGHLKKEYATSIELFPASPGTPVYTINGYNTSVIEVGALPDDAPNSGL